MSFEEIRRSINSKETKKRLTIPIDSETKNPAVERIKEQTFR